LQVRPEAEARRLRNAGSPSQLRVNKMLGLQGVGFSTVLEQCEEIHRNLT
jgi:hypothetical protein